jgi:hypothetical protein
MTASLEIQRLRSRLDSTFARAPTAESDIELQADFAKYLCVLVSGYLESAICALLLSYTRTRSAPEISSYVDWKLGPWTNPKAEKIVELFGAFSTGWRRDLELYLVDERKDSVNSLVALRHRIAHGESVGTSMSQIKSHYRTINEVIDHIAVLLEQ